MANSARPGIFFILAATLSLTTMPAGANKSPAGMAFIPAGTYTPQYSAAGLEGPVRVEAFFLDRHLVTNAEYLRFARDHSKWRRNHIAEIFADSNYLSHWPAPLTYGTASANTPVVYVSWFAARAYCESLGKMLPTQDQWEYAAAADEKMPGAATREIFYERILKWYSKPSTGMPGEVASTFANLWGVWDLHGLVWEWVDDFNTALVTGESRADGAVNKQLYCAAGAVGAKDFRNYAAFMRYAYRSSLQARYTVKNLGFRCAKEITHHQKGTE